MTFLSVLNIIFRDAVPEMHVSPNKIVTVEKAKTNNIKDEDGLTGVFTSPPSQDVVLLFLLNSYSRKQYILTYLNVNIKSYWFCSYNFYLTTSAVLACKCHKI